MKLIQENPFRIAGVLVNATEREIIKQKSKLSKMASIGRQVDSELDFSFLNKVNRAEVKLINKAFSEIEHNQDKLRHSLFWLMKVNIFDELAINYLKNGDLRKAIEILDKVTNGKEITSKNFSSFNNISTLKLNSNYNAEIKEALELKLKLIESKNFSEFVHLVADHTLIINNHKQSEIFIDDILTQLKNNYSILEILNLFNNCSSHVQKYISKRFSEEPYRNIENQIENCKKKRKVNKENAYEYGLRLYTETKTDLSLLKSIIAQDELNYKTIADQLANEIMQCGIDYFNESQKNDSSEDYLESAKKLTKLADSIAVGKLAKDRAKDSLATLADMKDREINDAIEILNTVKLAYEKAINDIDAQVARMKLTMSYNQTIDYSKINIIKAKCLNWDKVVEVVSNGINMKNIDVIQRCLNQDKIMEYKSLVDFLLSKLDPIQKSKVKYLCFWKDVQINTSNETGACYIATMAFGDYDHPKVIELRKFRDEFLFKTILGRRFIHFYYKYSPKLVERLKDKKVINMIIRKGLDQFLKIIKK